MAAMDTVETMQKPILALSKHIQDSIVQHCNQSSLFQDLPQGQLEIDGIICMSVHSRHDIVVKLHRTISVVPNRDSENSEQQSCPSLNGYQAVSECTSKTGHKQANDACMKNEKTTSFDSNFAQTLPSTSTIDEGLCCIKPEPTVEIDLEEDAPVKTKSDPLGGCNGTSAQKDSTHHYGNGNTMQDVTSKSDFKTDCCNNTSGSNHNHHSNAQSIHNHCSNAPTNHNRHSDTLPSHNQRSGAPTNQTTSTPDFSQSDFMMNNLNNFPAPIHHDKPKETIKDKPYTSSKDSAKSEPEVIKLDDDDEDVYEVNTSTPGQPSLNAASRNPETLLTDASNMQLFDDDIVAYLESKRAAAEASNSRMQLFERAHCGIDETPFECGICTTYFNSNDALIDHMETHVMHTRPPINSTERKELRNEVLVDDLILDEVATTEGDSNPTDLDIKILSCESVADMSEAKMSDRPLEYVGDAPAHFSNDSNNFDSENNEENNIDIATDNLECQNSDESTSNIGIMADNGANDSNDVDSQTIDDHNVDIATVTAKKGFKCDICCKRLSSKQSLQFHIRTHSGEKPFHCEICLRYFSAKTILKKHMLQVHTGEKPHKCTICLSKFACKQSLSIHFRTHTGEKPYECTICLRKFARKYHLTIHLRTHTGEKPYECTICLRKFARKHHLTIHLRTHTGEKPFECSICLQRFRHNGSLNSHLRIHTGKPLRKHT